MGLSTQLPGKNIPLHTEQIMRFIDKYYPEMVMVAGSEKILKFMNSVQDYLPDAWKPELAWVVVPMKGKVWHTLGIVICGNRTDAEMAKSCDAETIMEMQEILEVKTSPGWYYVAPEDYY
ncbi:hypothetical protein DFP72DRAFT_924664 [Ephemerocybe angulata]|uniref:Uncharacterized protein n=1 Tax=Ephemerocybe angulata TaxID=980116 RepID=A0A8H6HG87_9AGAR|nr:hypothetical protein DFP72DRAFT_924664 [Tulosesus angulatus]